MEDSLTAKAVPRRVGLPRERQDGTVRRSRRFPRCETILLYCTPSAGIGPAAEVGNRPASCRPTRLPVNSFAASFIASPESSHGRIRCFRAFPPRRCDSASRCARPFLASHQQNKPPGGEEVSLPAPLSPCEAATRHENATHACATGGDSAQRIKRRSTPLARACSFHRRQRESPAEAAVEVPLQRSNLG